MVKNNFHVLKHWKQNQNYMKALIGIIVRVNATERVHLRPGILSAEPFKQAGLLWSFGYIYLHQVIHSHQKDK